MRRLPQPPRAPAYPGPVLRTALLGLALHAAVLGTIGGTREPGASRILVLGAAALAVASLWARLRSRGRGCQDDWETGGWGAGGRGANRWRQAAEAAVTAAGALAFALLLGWAAAAPG